jgi:sugar diacid utilization regulator
VDADLLGASLIEDLLAGLPVTQLHSRARRAGLDPSVTHQLGVVVAADATAAAAAVKRELLMIRSPYLMAIVDNVLIIVVPDRIALHSPLRRACSRTSFRGGISLPFTLDAFPQAYHEAVETLALATPGQVLRLRDVRLHDYLLSRPTMVARRLVPAGLAQLDQVQRQTLRAFGQCDLNAEKTASRLNVHPKTVHYRLRRIVELTGLNVRSVTDLMDLLAGLSVLESDSLSAEDNA